MMRRNRVLIAFLFAAGMMAFWRPPHGVALELCSPEAKAMMRQATISEKKIARLCAAARRNSSVLAISLTRHEDQLGYCLVTLALHNNSNRYLNHLALTSANGRFEIFRFHNILPGGTGYASAKSRILLACDEVEEVGGIAFHWPASLRIADRHPTGQRLGRFKPELLHESMRWSR
jgi:hypothetical protein